MDITRISSRDIPFLRRRSELLILSRKDVGEMLRRSRGEPAHHHDCSSRIENCRTRRSTVFQTALRRRAAALDRASCPPAKICLRTPPRQPRQINTGEIINLLQKINDFGTTIVLVTHNREVVNALRRRVVTLADGRIASDHAHGKYLLHV